VRINFYEQTTNISQLDRVRTAHLRFDAATTSCWLTGVPTYDGIFREEIGQLMISREQIGLIVFDEIKERVREWIPPQLTEK
jgi:uncharacterized protein YqkB